jgi:sulfite reductase (ferredoxin)
VSRKVSGYAVPHFQVVLGGEWTNNAGSYGLPAAAVPSKNIPEVVTRIAERYVLNREKGESFQSFVKRVGKAEIRKLLDDLIRVPGENRFYFSDWGDPREYSVDDIGVGECAGEVVSSFEFDMAAAEREVFEAQLMLERNDAQAASKIAYEAMLHAARALVKSEYWDVRDDADEVVREFRKRFYETEKFFDPFAGGKFAQYLFAAHQRPSGSYSAETAKHLVEEAQLFIEASHSCHNRMAPVKVAANV